MNLFSQQYQFKGASISEGNDIEHDSEEVIYMEFNVKDLLMGLKFFQKDADVAVIKLAKDKFPLLRINAQEMDTSAEKSPKYRTEIPVIIVPREKWETFPVPNDLQFNTVMKSPRYNILKKYVEIFKNFKHIHMTFRNTTLQLHSDEIGSRVSTTFENVVYIDKDSEKLKADVKLDAKKLALYFSSISALNSIKVMNLTLAVTNQKMLKLYFQNGENSLSFHYVIASQVNDENDEDMSDNNNSNHSDNDL